MSGSLQPQTGFYAQAGQAQPPANPLAMIGQVADTGNKLVQMQNGMLQNNQMTMQQKARQALGPIMQQSIDPATGQPDLPKAMSLMSQNPDTAWMAPDFFHSMLENSKTLADTAKTKLDMAKAEHDAYGVALAPLMAQVKQTGMVSRDDMVPAISRLVTAGVLPKDTALDLLGQTALPDVPGDRFKTEQNRKFNANQIQQIALAQAGAANSLNTVLGKIELPNLGGSINPTQVSPLLGTSPAPGTGPLVMTPTPEALNAPKETIDNSGQQTVKPAVQTMPMFNGAGGQINPGVGGTAPTTKLDPVSETFLKTEVPRINSAAATAGTVLKVSKEIEDMQNEARTGPGSDFRNRMASVGTALGFTPDIVRSLQGGDGTDPVTAAQVLQKQMFIKALTTLKDTTGNPREGQEIQNEIIGAIGSNELTPKARDAINGLINYQADLAQKEQKAFSLWMTDPTHQAKDFPVNWQHYIQSKGLTPTLDAKINEAKMQLGAAGKSSFKGQGQ